MLPEASTEINTSPKLPRLERIQEKLEEELVKVVVHKKPQDAEEQTLLSECDRALQELKIEIVDSEPVEVVVHKEQQGAKGQTPMSKLVQALTELQKAAGISPDAQETSTKESPRDPRGSLSELRVTGERSSTSSIESKVVI